MVLFSSWQYRRWLIATTRLLLAAQLHTISHLQTGDAPLFNIGDKDMYAVITSGGKQYRVAEGDTLKLEKLDAKEGEKIEFEQVLMVADGDDIKLGSPFIENFKVNGEVLAHGRHKKIKIVKFRRRQNSMRINGHRQDYTEVKIVGIGAGGTSKAKAAESKPTATKAKSAAKSASPKTKAKTKTAGKPKPKETTTAKDGN